MVLSTGWTTAAGVRFANKIVKKGFEEGHLIIYDVLSRIWIGHVCAAKHRS